MKIITKVTATVTVALLAVACGGQNAETTPNTGPKPVAGSEAPPGVTAAQNRVDQGVVAKLASARCDHEQKCNNIGQGQKYATLDVCEAQLESATTSDLNAQSCARGLDENAIDRCISAIGAEQCSLSLDTLSRMTDCRTGALCMR